MAKSIYNTDSKIIEGIVSGDEMALRVLYKLYYSIIYKFIVNNQGSDDDAKDIYQEGIIIVHHNIKQGIFKQESGLKTYLYSICRRLWLTELKNKERHHTRVIDTNASIEMSSDKLEELENNAVQFKHLAKCLDKLGDPCKTILHDFYISHLSMQEIADKMNYTNMDNAKTQKYKCLQRLKKIFFEK